MDGGKRGKTLRKGTMASADVKTDSVLLQNHFARL